MNQMTRSGRGRPTHLLREYPRPTCLGRPVGWCGVHDEDPRRSDTRHLELQLGTPRATWNSAGPLSSHIAYPPDCIGRDHRIGYKDRGQVGRVVLHEYLLANRLITYTSMEQGYKSRC